VRDGTLNEDGPCDFRGQSPSSTWAVAPRVTLANFHDQDLRNTAVTWLMRAGCDVFELASITGHELASIHTILKHYLADHPERADVAINRLVEWFDHQCAVGTPSEQW
jgi:hypothetical protein